MTLKLDCKHCGAHEGCAVVGGLAICRTCVREANSDFAAAERERLRRELEDERGGMPPRKGA